MDYTSIFVFVIASFGNPVYYDMIKMRKLQLEKYKIPNMFLFDGPCPENYKPDENDVFYDPPQEPFPVEFTVPNRQLNPHMIIKFLKAIKQTTLDKYKFIIRVNLSTFINFPILLKTLQETPTSRVCLAPFGENHRPIHLLYNIIKEEYTKSCCDSHKHVDSKSSLLIERYYREKPAGEPCCDLMRDMRYLSKTEYYLTPSFTLLHGALHVYTLDFIKYLQKSVELDNPNLYIHNDDLVLSFFVNKYGCNYIPIELNNDQSALNKLITRIKNVQNRQIDIAVWRYLLQNVDNITY